jgi:hypothetical protein
MRTGYSVRSLTGSTAYLETLRSVPIKWDLGWVSKGGNYMVIWISILVYSYCVAYLLGRVIDGHLPISILQR